MLRRRALLTGLLFGPAIIPVTNLMKLSWRSSSILQSSPSSYDFDWMEELSRTLAEEIRKEIDEEFLQVVRSTIG